VLLRAYNRNDDDVEEALHIENPDLASLGPILPINTLIVLPEIQQQTVSEVVNVWD
jgi:phage tail protein X